MLLQLVHFVIRKISKGLMFPMWLFVIFIMELECYSWRQVEKERVQATKINKATVQSQHKKSGGPMRFGLCFWTMKGRFVGKVSNEIKCVFSRENSCYNHNYYFDEVNSCKFLKNDIVNFCIGAFWNYQMQSDKDIENKSM